MLQRHSPVRVLQPLRHWLSALQRQRPFEPQLFDAHCVSRVQAAPPWPRHSPDAHRSVPPQFAWLLQVHCPVARSQVWPAAFGLAVHCALLVQRCLVHRPCVALPTVLLQVWPLGHWLSAVQITGMGLRFGEMSGSGLVLRLLRVVEVGKAMLVPV